MYTGLYVKYTFFLSDFNKTWIFSAEFRKRLKSGISWQSVQWEPSCSKRTEGQTDMTKLMVAFRNYAKSAKESKFIYSLKQTTFLSSIYTSGNEDRQKNIRIVPPPPKKKLKSLFNGYWNRLLK